MNIKVANAKEFKAKLSEAKKLQAEGQEVVIIVEDIEEFFKFYDADTVADMLDGIPFVENEKETNQV